MHSEPQEWKLRYERRIRFCSPSCKVMLIQFWELIHCVSFCAIAGMKRWERRDLRMGQPRVPAQEVHRQGGNLIS
jgi:hypothetical protein